MDKKLQIARALTSNGWLFDSVDDIKRLFSSHLNDGVLPMPGEPTVFFVKNGEDKVKLVLGIGKYNSTDENDRHVTGEADEYEIFDIVGVEGSIKSLGERMNSAEESLNDDAEKLEDIDGEIDSLKTRMTNAEQNIGIIDVPINGIAQDEKIISSDNGELYTVFNIHELDENKKIKFTGKDGAVIGEIDATQFLTDGILERVGVETESGVTYLVFYFNTESGNDPIKVNAKDFAIQYTSDNNYLTVDNQAFKIGLVVGRDGLALTSDLNELSAITHTLDDKYSGITKELDTRIGEGFKDDNDNPVSISHKITMLEEKIDDEFSDIEDTMAKGEDLDAITRELTDMKNILKATLTVKTQNPTARVELEGGDAGDGIHVLVGSKKNLSVHEYYTDGSYIYPNRTVPAQTTTAVTRQIIDEKGNVFQTGEVTIKNREYRGKAVIDYSDGVEVSSLFGDDTVKLSAGTLTVVSENYIKGFYPLFVGSFTLAEFPVFDGDEFKPGEVRRLLTDAFINNNENFTKVQDYNASRFTFYQDNDIFVMLVPDDDRFEDGLIKAVIDDSDYGFNIIDSFKMVEMDRSITFEGVDEDMFYTAYIYKPDAPIEQDTTYKIKY